MTPPNSFVSSGSSPPVDDTATTPLPPELVEALANLLAEAIIADMRQFPNLAELRLNQDPTVKSLSGLNQRRRSPRSRAAARSAPRAES